MLTPEGCASRREHLMQVTEAHSSRPDWAIVADPRHLMYFANFPVEPISWAAPPPGLLLIQRSGPCILAIDNLAARRPDQIWVDRLELVSWYNFADSPTDRGRAVFEHFVKHAPSAPPEVVGVEMCAVPSEVLLWLNRAFPDCRIVPLDDAILEMRRSKQADELALLRRSIAAGEAGHNRVWDVARPGATELEVYSEIVRECTNLAGQPVVVYGDFCSGPRTWLERGGPPTARRLEAGDLMILDFSVVLGGYRADFANTMVIGAEPTAEQRRLFELCRVAMSSGERSICHGAPASDVFEMLNRPLIEADPALRITGHGGHGIGLAHPEAPFIVSRSTDRLRVNDVITLEPGVYVEGVGGMRFEHNYLVTEQGYEQLTNHRIARTP